MTTKKIEQQVHYSSLEYEEDLYWEGAAYRRLRNKVFDTRYKMVLFDIRKGYGGDILLKEIEEKFKNQWVQLEVEQSFYSMYHFAVWLESWLHRWKPEHFEINCFSLYQYKKVNHIMKKHIVSSISKVLNESEGVKYVLMMIGLQNLKSQEILIFINYMNCILAEQAKIFVCVDGVCEMESIFGFSISHILMVKTKDILLEKEDIRGMAIRYLDNDILEFWNVEQLIDILFNYFGGWSYGIKYVLNLLSKEGSKTLDDICSLKHELYHTYCCYFISNGITDEERKFLMNILELSCITEESCNQQFLIKWAKGYLEKWEEVGCLIYEQDTYKIIGMMREYLLSTNGYPDIHNARDTLYGGNKEVKVISLGKFSVCYQGREPQWRTKKAKELFMLLFYKQGERISKEMIVGSLWPDYNNEKANQLFFTTMSYLRKNLAEIALSRLILTKNKSYYLNMEMVCSDYQILLEIKNAVDKGLWEKIEELPDIMTIYNGEFLEFCTGEWFYDMQRYLERICLQCLQKLASHEMSLQNYPIATDYLNFFIQINPYSNDIVSMLLGCYGNMKDFGSMKNIYEKIKKLYCEELNMEIDSDITEIYRKYIPKDFG